MTELVVFAACDICGAANPRYVLESPALDGPLVECVRCGFRYVGRRKSALAFGQASAAETTAKISAANRQFRYLRLEEEHRLAVLNAAWRLDLIREYTKSGRLLEVGCARGDFLSVAKKSFEVYGVE